jgi:hypothetical protein
MMTLFSMNDNNIIERFLDIKKFIYYVFIVANQLTILAFYLMILSVVICRPNQ